METSKEPLMIGEVLQKMSYNRASVLKSNDPWEEMELTEGEVLDALNTARRWKYDREKATIEAARRARYREEILQPWNKHQMYGFLMEERLPKIGFSRNDGADLKKVFRMDHGLPDAMHALCMYFTNDPDFEKVHIPDGEGGSIFTNWRLNKGLMICGNVGSGKTALMKLFARNKRQCYDVVNCIDLSMQFSRKGDEAIETFRKVRYEPKDPNWFYQDKIGLCLDDMGTEEEKVHFGNKTNVIAEIILSRYAAELPYDMTHLTTNLESGEAIEKYYGPRVYSRMLEMFNMIDLIGPDRRKI